MDFILDMARKDKESLQLRLAEYTESVLIASNLDGVLEVNGFHSIKADNLLDMIKSYVLKKDARPIIYFMSDHELPLAELLAHRPVANGFRIVRLIDIPEQHPSPIIDSALYEFRELSLIGILNDLADQELIQRQMTEEELAHSNTKRQDKQRRNAKGDIRAPDPQKYDFDHAEESVDDDDGE